MDDMGAKKQIIEEFMQFMQKKAGDSIRSRKSGKFPGADEEVMPMEGEEGMLEEEVVEESMPEMEEEVPAMEEMSEEAPVVEEGVAEEQELTGQPDDATIQRMLSRVKRRR